jgi:hypothetical protein
VQLPVEPTPSRLREDAAHWLKKNGTHYSHIKPKSEAEAKEAYEALQPLFAPDYVEWHRLVDQAMDRQIEAQPVS